MGVREGSERARVCAGAGVRACACVWRSEMVRVGDEKAFEGRKKLGAESIACALFSPPRAPPTLPSSRTCAATSSSGPMTRQAGPAVPAEAERGWTVPRRASTPPPLLPPPPAVPPPALGSGSEMKAASSSDQASS